MTTAQTPIPKIPMYPTKAADVRCNGVCSVCNVDSEEPIFHEAGCSCRVRVAQSAPSP